MNQNLKLIIHKVSDSNPLAYVSFLLALPHEMQVLLGDSGAFEELVVREPFSGVRLDGRPGFRHDMDLSFEGVCG
jgi:hypothetical protein